MNQVKNKIKLLKLIRKNYQLSFREVESAFDPILWQVRNKKTGFLSEEFKTLRRALLYCVTRVVSTHQYLKLKGHRDGQILIRQRELINRKHTKLF